MKAEADFLSLTQLLGTARELGLDVNERTLLYYVSRGLLPKGERRPGADGRVVFWPGSTVKRLARILQLKGQGYKLEQIRLALEQGRSSVPEQRPDEWRREVAFRYLRNFVAGESQAARTLLDAHRPDWADEAGWMQALREYEVAQLTPLIGTEAALSCVAEFMLALPPREVHRRMHRFRADSAARKAALASDFSEAAATVRRCVADFLLGRLDATDYLSYLQSQRSLLQATRAQVDGAGGGTADRIARALDAAVAALVALSESGKQRTRARELVNDYSLQLERLRVCQEIASHTRWLRATEADLEEA